MAAETLPWTKLLNYATAPVVTPALEATSDFFLKAGEWTSNPFLQDVLKAMAWTMRPTDPAAPIPNWMAMQVLVTLVLIAVFALARMRLSVENPGGLQHTFEGIRGFIRGLCRDVIGHHWERFVPFLVSLGLFLLFCNLLGLVPGFYSPTEHVTVPLGAALAAFIYYNLQGFRSQGVTHYVMHFFGPQDPSMSLFIRLPISLLMFPIEVVSHVARVMSLTIRLWANIFAGEQLLLVSISLVPLLIPISMLGLHVAVAAVQTYVFVLLTTVYLQGAVAEEH